jgi:hypothetical protein
MQDDAKESSLMYQIQVVSFHLGLLNHAIFIQNGMSMILYYKFIILREKESFTFLSVCSFSTLSMSNVNLCS